MTARASTLGRRLRLALLLGPVAAALLIAGAELLLQLAPDPRPRYFDRAVDENGREELVAHARPPFSKARFRLERFDARPAAGTRRLLVVGDSTAYGFPFDPPVPFSDGIAVRLRHLLPDASFEVVNLASSGMCSEHVADLLGEIGAAGAEVLIVYVGHNEFIDHNLLAVLSPWTDRLRRVLRRSRLACWLAPPSDGQPLVIDTVKTGGELHDLPLFTAAESERAMRRYDEKLREIVATARAHGAAVVLCRPVADFVDTSPQYAVFSATAGDEARRALRRGLPEVRDAREAIEARAGPSPVAGDPAIGELLARAAALVELDPGLATARFEHGLALRLAGRRDDAWAELRAAADADGLPVRACSAHDAALERVARELAVPLVDPWPAFLAAAEPGLPGQDGLFVDYCHPDVLGHQILADAIARELAAASLLAPPESWRFDGQPSHEEFLRRAGFRADQQASAFAQTALFLIGQSFFDEKRRGALAAAEGKVRTALALDSECATAWLASGALAAIRGESSEALDAFDRAARLDPAVLEQLREPYESNPSVRAMFEAAGLEFREGRVARKE